MLFKRLGFIAALLAIFAVCFYYMNQSYDPLARYPYADETEREILLEYLDQEDINYLITQQIKPEQIMPFIEHAEFDIANTLWYSLAMQTQEDDADYIIHFINEYKNRLSYGTLKEVLQNYSYSSLIRYFESSQDYDEKSVLVSSPSDPYLVLEEHQTVFNYEPQKLTLVEGLPVVATQGTSKGFYLHPDVIEPLTELLRDAGEINGTAGGGLQIERAYTSFEAQVSIYDTAQKTYQSAVSYYEDIAGESEFQLGYTVRFALPEEFYETVEKERDKDTFHYEEALAELSDLQREQITWLKENAHRYGFVIRYEQGKESITKKAWQPFTLRYVGKDNARRMHDENRCMEEMQFAEE